MSYAESLKLKNKKTSFIVGGFIEEINKNYNIDTIRKDLKIATNKTTIIESGDDLDLIKIKNDIDVILKNHYKDQPQEIKQYLKKVKMAKNLALLFSVLGFSLMLFIIIKTGFVNEWLFCFVSWILGCVSLWLTLRIILKEWSKDNYVVRLRKKRRIRNKNL